MVLLLVKLGGTITICECCFVSSYDRYISTHIFNVNVQFLQLADGLVSGTS